jgi:hypothetical protein
VSLTGEVEIGHWKAFHQFGRIGLESMCLRFDHRIPQLICARSTNPNPGRPTAGGCNPVATLVPKCIEVPKCLEVPKCPRRPRCSPQLFAPKCPSAQGAQVPEVPYVPQMPRYYEVPNTPTGSARVQGFTASSVVWVTGLFTNFWSWVADNNVKMVVNNSNLQNDPPRGVDCAYEHLFFDEDRWCKEQGKAS